MFSFTDFVKAWETVSVSHNGFINLDLDHPLSPQIGYYFSERKSLVIEPVRVIKDLQSTYAFDIEFVLLADGNTGLKIKLLSDEFEDVFLRLCWDLIMYSRDAKKPFNAFIIRYRFWQKLFQQKFKDQLSRYQQKGLFGELLYLSEIIDEIGSEKAVDAWKGPEGSDQDFIFEKGWTEVKTVGTAAKAVQISSMEQLQQTEIGYLHVYFVEDEPAGPNRLKLPELVRIIENKLNENPFLIDKFENKLTLYGYREKDACNYHSFWKKEESEYIVNQDFPKLTSRNVPSGIVECTYKISLPAIEGFRR